MVTLSITLLLNKVYGHKFDIFRLKYVKRSSGVTSITLICVVSVNRGPLLLDLCGDQIKK